jgi:uncharacterized membrane protein YbaN (DUF454 family)
MENMLKKKIISLIGSLCSIAGIIGIVLSNALNEIFLFVIAAISGLFTVALMGQNNR